MNKLRLSKSKYCKLKQCPKIIWLNEYKEEERIPKARKSVLDNGTRVGILAKSLFGKYEDVKFNEDLSVMVENTNRLLKNKPNIIAEASFIYDNNFCSVDILKNEEDGVEIFEVKSSTDVKDIYIDDVAYQYYILNNLGYNVKKASIVYLNKKYIRHGDLDIDKLFNIEDIKQEVQEKQEEIKNNIEKINIFMEEHNKEKEPDIDIGMHCRNPYECEYWEYCTRKLPKPNVFDIANMRWNKKFEKYKEGLINFEELQKEDLSEKFLEQIDFEINSKEPKIEKEAIKELMNSLKYPLYFIDFETFQLPIPEYEGTWSYQQLPFQYSLHIIKYETSEIEHREFLAQIDDKEFLRHFAESMIEDIKEDGSVIIYNSSFEPARINEISKIYPDLEEKLMKIKNNIVDFQKPFRRRNYYMKEMEGSYSIKTVLPSLYPDEDELNYKNLPIVHNGEEASEAFLSLKEKSKKQQEEIRKALLVYCELDTYAMVKLWEKFKEIIGE